MREIEFSRWQPWLEREKLDGIRIQPGVYLLAKSAHHLQLSDPTPTNENIVYIGETCSQTLWKRLWGFHSAAQSGAPRHAGGETYHARFGGFLDDLYVSILPHGEVRNEVDSAYIRHIERLAIWRFVEAFNRMPICNKK